MAIGERMESLLFTVTDGMFGMEPGTNRFLFATQRANQADAVDLWRTAHARQFQQRGHHVFQANQFIRKQGRLKFEFRRRSDNERNIRCPFVRLAFPKVPMIAEHLAMVSGKHDDPGTVRGFTALFELRYERSNLFIQLFDEAKISSLRGAKSFALEQYAVALFIAFGRERWPIYPIAVGGR